MSAEALAAEMVRQKIWVLAGYTGKPIYLCSESLTAKKTYGDSRVAVQLQSRERPTSTRKGCVRAPKSA